MFQYFKYEIFLLNLDVETIEYGTISPSHQAVYEGSNVFIICNSSKKTTWTKNKKKIRNRHSVVNNTIFMLYNVLEEDSGIYTCHGTFSKAKKKNSFKANSELLVGGNFT